MIDSVTAYTNDLNKYSDRIIQTSDFALNVVMDGGLRSSLDPEYITRLEMVFGILKDAAEGVKSTAADMEIDCILKAQ